MTTLAVRIAENQIERENPTISSPNYRTNVVAFRDENHAPALCQTKLRADFIV